MKSEMHFVQFQHEGLAFPVPSEAAPCFLYSFFPLLRPFLTSGWTQNVTACSVTVPREGEPRRHEVAPWLLPFLPLNFLPIRQR